MMYCSACGKEVMDEAVICPNCGCMINEDGIKPNGISSGRNKNIQVSVILGIMGIVFALLFAIIGHIASIIGIILGIKEYKETGKMTGLILSILGEVCSIFSSIIGAIIFSGLF